MPSPARVTPPFSPAIEHFALDRSVVFLNHGSFGSVPVAVAAEQERWQRRMESEPIRWFVSELEPALDAARERMAAFVGCDADGFAFVANATAGVSTVARSLDLKPGDELLTSTHEYNACNNALRHVARHSGAAVVSVPLPYPVTGPDEIVSLLTAAVTARTRFVLVSHITSPTGLILPVERLIPALRDAARAAGAERMEIMVDGAHVPAHLPVKVGQLACDYYTGNFHKWLCAPKGSAFLWVAPDKRQAVHPLVISHGANADRPSRTRFRLEFDFLGSMDYSPFLATPAAIDFLAGLHPNGVWGAVNHCRGMVAQAREHLADLLGTPSPAPPEMFGTMAAVLLPPHDGDRTARLLARPTAYHDALQDRLVDRWGLQVPVIRMAELPPRPGVAAVPQPAGPSGVARWVRLSAAIYNHPEQYRYLGRALQAELAEEARL